MKKLRVASKDAPASLGLSTIMDKALAQKHGPAYVRLAVLAIDIDRASIFMEDDVPPPPFGLEVFLVEVYLATHAADLAMLEDVVLDVLEGDRGEKTLGTQLPFAVHHAAKRGRLGEEALGWFRQWREEPTELYEALDALFENRAESARVLAERVLALEIDPPLAPPTREALEAMR